ncbi:multimeric flavodoxin WrbA [Bradyrhizobium sp. LA7.1]
MIDRCNRASDDLAEYDAIVAGTGVPFGGMSSHVASFLEE